MLTPARGSKDDTPRGGGEKPPRPVPPSGSRPPGELAGRWARAALDRLLSSSGPAPSLLLTGEPGTGRRTLARGFHDLRHPDGRAPLETVRPAAGAGEDGLYAAVFGREGRRPGTRGGLYWPGAIERARGGTVVLERLEAFPARVLEALGSYLEDGRLRPLDGDGRRAPPCALVAIAEGAAAPVRELRPRFDVALDVPPLRDRRGDVEDLFWHFARAIGFGGFPARAAKHFAALPWRGNVPELREKVEAEAACWIESCSSPGRSRDEVEREVRESWAPRTVPAVPADPADLDAAGKRPPPGARGTKKDMILSLAEQIARGEVSPKDAARRAMTSVSYTRRVLRQAGVNLAAGK